MERYLNTKSLSYLDVKLNIHLSGCQVSASCLKVMFSQVIFNNTQMQHKRSNSKKTKSGYIRATLYLCLMKMRTCVQVPLANGRASSNRLDQVVDHPE